MAYRYYNPFQGIDVSVPIEFREDFARFCQTGGRAIIDHRPFPRMVDMWFAAVCFAARKKLAPVELQRRETYKVIDGSIFGNDPWRVNALMLLALTYSEDISVVSEPRRMMTIANGLAVAGLAHIVAALKDGGAEPIWIMSDAIVELMRPAVNRDTIDHQPLTGG